MDVYSPCCARRRRLPANVSEPLLAELSILEIEDRLDSGHDNSSRHVHDSVLYKVVAALVPRLLLDPAKLRIRKPQQHLHTHSSTHRS